MDLKFPHCMYILINLCSVSQTVNMRVFTIWRDEAEVRILNR